MGLWWKDVKKVPEGGISIKGDPNAWSKWNPFWRFQHKWMIFIIENDNEPYYVFFDDGKDKMCLKKPINTAYFAARIGSQDLRFSAVTDLSDPESVSITYSFCGSRYSWSEIQNLSSVNAIMLI